MLIRFSENKNIRTNDLLHLRKRLIARTQGPNGRERTTPRLIPNYLETIFLYKGTQQETIWHREETPKTICSGIYSISQLNYFN